MTWISPFAHAAAAPLHPVHATAAVAMTLAGAALAAVGVGAFLRRDLAGA